MNLELKVGIFAFIGIMILTLTIFSIGEIRIFSPGYTITVLFSFASGIDMGAGVKVAGVEAGEVKNIEVGYDQNEGQAKIALLIWLDKKVKLPRDSQAYVNILGLLGERYLEIIPGQDYANLLKDGDVLVGRDPLSTESLMEVVRKAGESLDQVLISISEVLDEKTKANLRETIANFRDCSESMKAVSGDLAQGEMGRSLVQALDSVNEVLDIQTKADLKEAIGSLRKLSYDLQLISGRLERGEGKLGALLKPKKKRPETEK